MYFPTWRRTIFADCLMPACVSPSIPTIPPISAAMSTKPMLRFSARSGCPTPTSGKLRTTVLRAHSCPKTCAIVTLRKSSSIGRRRPAVARVLELPGTNSQVSTDLSTEGFGLPVSGFDHVPFGDLEALEAACGVETAGILIEPIQGESGVRALSTERLIKIRVLCDRHRLLLIFDEVQTGIGRTGHLFAYQGRGVAPDILASAKGLGNGFPVAACLATEAAAAGMTAGTHGSTFGGNPLAMTVASEVVDIVRRPGFLEQVRSNGE